MLSDQFKKTEVIEKLFSLIESDNDLTVWSALQVLEAMFNKFPYYIESKTDEDEDPFWYLQMYNNQKNMNDKVIPEIHQLIVDNIGKVEHIIQDYDCGSREVTYGSEAKQFGYTRIQAVKVMRSLIKWGQVDYAVGFINSFTSLLQFSKEHPWNSVLHKLTEEIFADVLRSNSGYSEDYKTVFLEETKLDTFIAELDAESTFEHS